MRDIFINEDKINIDSGTFFGRGAFETILVKDKPVLLKEHINRLNKAIEYLNIGEKIDLDFISNIINGEKYSNIAVKIAVTEKNIIFTTREIKYNENTYKNGFKVRLSKVMRNSSSNICRHKTLNYLENIIEYENANKDGFNETLFLNEKHNLSEGCTSNIFIVKDENIYTPTIDCGILPGVLRAWVIENFSVMEKEISKEEFLNCDEMFLTNSLVGVVKISEFENKKFHSKISDKVKAHYDEFIFGGDY